MGSGKAEASIAEETYDANPSIREIIHQTLNNRLLGAQMSSFRYYELLELTKTLVNADGSSGIYIEPKSAVLSLTARTAYSNQNTEKYCYL